MICDLSTRIGHIIVTIIITILLILLITTTIIIIIIIIITTIIITIIIIIIIIIITTTIIIIIIVKHWRRRYFGDGKAEQGFHTGIRRHISNSSVWNPGPIAAGKLATTTLTLRGEHNINAQRHPYSS